MISKEKFMKSFRADIQTQKEKKELAEKLAERIKADKIDEIVKEVLNEEFFGQ